MLLRRLPTGNGHIPGVPTVSTLNLHVPELPTVLSHFVTSSETTTTPNSTPARSPGWYRIGSSCRASSERGARRQLPPRPTPRAATDYGQIGQGDGDVAVEGKICDHQGDILDHGGRRLHTCARPRESISPSSPFLMSAFGFVLGFEIESLP